ncbi:Peptidoglycan/xylan/chitin deacetylase, PgdA/CDA1 family [Micromonospora purpureochromogenes]|uniref:Peptidoglycan/xylan/chitin deacetylase, PgdA/CDA1 family n=1 Tax=Micromonospora purpureochromogenes TaxID=47872 RepID=A0A1C4VFA4_9ACTN|nr:polysaccharide deacetylase family protein [Micromonospora purpureochromogenes]SCE82521.1 Peptidoglycan/xylan/chitin deacetylase, PgdA/CDA1 family [Micromonospora purpureochromogenes]
MGPRSTGRAVGVVVLVLAALLGSAYALGRSLIPDQPRSRAGVTASVHDTEYGDQSPGSGTPTATPSGRAEAAQEPDARHPTGNPDDGPFGSRETTGSPEVALTFDDGPDPRYTPQVLEILREFHVRATFCVVGENAQAHPELIRAIAADGHTLCNHTWQHDVQLGQRSPAAIRADLLRTNQVIHDIVPDAPIAWYRQPGGAWTYPVVSVARELGMTSLHWTVDPSDWEAPGAARITTQVTGGVGPGSVVLLHDAGGDRQGTVDALRHILPDLTSRFRLEALPVDGTT